MQTRKFPCTQTKEICFKNDAAQRLRTRLRHPRHVLRTPNKTQLGKDPKPKALERGGRGGGRGQKLSTLLCGQRFHTLGIGVLGLTYQGTGAKALTI